MHANLRATHKWWLCLLQLVPCICCRFRFRGERLRGVSLPGKRRRRVPLRRPICMTDVVEFGFFLGPELLPPLQLFRRRPCGLASPGVKPVGSVLIHQLPPPGFLFSRRREMHQRQQRSRSQAHSHDKTPHSPGKKRNSDDQDKHGSQTLPPAWQAVEGLFRNLGSELCPLGSIGSFLGRPWGLALTIRELRCAKAAKESGRAGPKGGHLTYHGVLPC